MRVSLSKNAAWFATKAAWSTGVGEEVAARSTPRTSTVTRARAVGEPGSAMSCATPSRAPKSTRATTMPRNRQTDAKKLGSGRSCRSSETASMEPPHSDGADRRGYDHKQVKSGRTLKRTRGGAALTMIEATEGQAPTYAEVLARLAPAQKSNRGA